MGLKRTVAPLRMACELSDAKDQIALADDSLDNYVMRLIEAATASAERYTGRSLITQTWRLAIDAFPACEIRIPRPPLAAVSSIQYIDEAGALQTLSSSLYVATSSLEPASVEPVYGESWPSTRPEREAVLVIYTAGYGNTPSSVPRDIQHAILLMVAQWFTYREPTISGTIITEVPMSARWLLDGYKTGASPEYYELVG